MTEFYNVTTNIGDAEIAKAIANNTKLNITHIVFGDGNGAVPTPAKARTSLVREVHRQAVTKYERHPTVDNWIIIETIIPSNIGGFWIREMGIIADAKLISHGSHAPFEKVADPEGVSEYRLKFTQDVRDGDVIAIKLDESLIYASQKWVEENYIPRHEIVDDLKTNDATKTLSAKQGKILQDNKLDKTANAVSASKLQTARQITASGAATGSVRFDGSKNEQMILSLANSGVVAGSYGSALKVPSITVNNKGLITSVSEKEIQVINDLSTGGSTKILSAEMGKKLDTEKLGKTANAVSASKLQTARQITASGAATGSVRFDGSKNEQMILSLANSGVVAGSYGSALKVPSITVNNKGLITSVSEKEIQVINDLSTGGSTKILSAEMGKKLNGDKLGKTADAVGVQVPISTTTSDTAFITALKNHSGVWFDNGYGKFFNQYSMGFSVSKQGAGFMLFGMDVIQAQLKVMSGVVRDNGSIDFIRKQTFLNTEDTAANAAKLAVARQIKFTGDVSGSTRFDGSTDVTCSIKLTNNALDILSYSPIAYPKSIAPTGFLMMMGQSISQSQYPILYSLYGYKLPDLRGEFIRGWDNGRGVDAGRQISTWQNEDFRSHNHNVVMARFSHGRDGSGSNYATWSDGDMLGIRSSLANAATILKESGGPETRPRNIAFNYIVKAG